MGRRILSAVGVLLAFLLSATLVLGVEEDGTVDVNKPGKDVGEAEVQGTSILVTTNSEGVTEVYIGKPNISVTDILGFISSTLNPFSRSKRSLHGNPSLVPLGSMLPTTYDLVKDSMMLVAPVFSAAQKTSTDPGVSHDQTDYVAYVLPDGLSSLPIDLKMKLLMPRRGMRKVGLLMLPTDVDLMGTTGRQPSNGLFPLDRLKIREIKLVVNGDVESTSLDAVMDSLGFAKPGYVGLPWLILRDVAEKESGGVAGTGAESREDRGAGVGESPSAADGLRAEGGAAPATEEGAPTAEGGDVQEYGTILVNKDGAVTWHTLPFFSPIARVPIVPVPPIPHIPPIPQIPPFPYAFPWFNRIPIPDPYYFPFNIPPIPFWGLNVPPPFNPNPFIFPVPIR